MVVHFCKVVCQEMVLSDMQKRPLLFFIENRFGSFATFQLMEWLIRIEMKLESICEQKMGCFHDFEGLEIDANFNCLSLEHS